MKRQAVLLILCMLFHAVVSAGDFGGGSGSHIPYRPVFHNRTATLLKELNGKALKTRVAELLRLKRPELLGWHAKINENGEEIFSISIRIPMLDGPRGWQVYYLLCDYMDERRKGLTSAEAMKTLKARRVEEPSENEDKKEKKDDKLKKPLPDGYIPGLIEDE
jgi:hypothetical protein